MHGKKKKESNEQSESPAPLLSFFPNHHYIGIQLLQLLTYRETGEQNEELEASTMERTNSNRTNSRGFPSLTVSASTTPKVIFLFLLTF
ncbi:hypothetical protein Goarm_011264 [Gossypium armourianum]|uniref:Uncharacterized protein n=1 Tax=Gossypium armourianum TaxID=34283 RepID=A0A7J9IWA6_9ROSI|nr:hypothetical protein [Gossypium armourianum]